MNTATTAGVLSTIIFAASTLPMVLRAAWTRDVSSYSRSHLLMTNAGNAVHTVYVASLPPGPIWLLHCIYSCVSAFMFAAHVRWSQHRAQREPTTSAGSAPGIDCPGSCRAAPAVNPVFRLVATGGSAGRRGNPGKPRWRR
jgi:hypothetical protein